MFGNFTSNPQPRFTLRALMKFTPLNDAVQTHLQRVYSVLAAGIAITACGVWIQMNFMRIHSFFALIGYLFISHLVLARRTRGSAVKDVAPMDRVCLSIFAFLLQGMALGDLMAIAFQFPAVVPSAFFGTMAIFSCMSVSAIFARRRSFFYLIGGLGSVLSLLVIVSFISLLVGIPDIVFMATVYIGLLMFVGYILVHTQMIIERAYQGECDFISDAFSLYTDIVAVFIRILVILMNNEKKESKK
eukprot:GHVR01118150.1.p1 GENE.GHVR01118150.1~~GHVR01118150.1.p1  ORF type:complete len:254 (+),score=-2.62 GHVR01118150.1:29-763(+)